jgi:hypothetical protein
MRSLVSVVATPSPSPPCYRSARQRNPEMDPWCLMVSSRSGIDKIRWTLINTRPECQIQFSWFDCGTRDASGGWGFKNFESILQSYFSSWSSYIRPPILVHDGASSMMNWSHIHLDELLLDAVSFSIAPRNDDPCQLQLWNAEMKSESMRSPLMIRLLNYKRWNRCRSNWNRFSSKVDCGCGVREAECCSARVPEPRMSSDFDGKWIATSLALQEPDLWQWIICGVPHQMQHSAPWENLRRMPAAWARQGNSKKVGCSQSPKNCSEPFPCPPFRGKWR